jgi:hypothetical protein
LRHGGDGDDYEKENDEGILQGTTTQGVCHNLFEKTFEGLKLKLPEALRHLPSSRGERNS